MPIERANRFTSHRSSRRIDPGRIAYRNGNAGGPWSEHRLLALGRAWELAAKPRVAPFLTPSLKAGKGPPSVQNYEALVKDGQGRALAVSMTYTPSNAYLRLNMPAHAQGITALTLHRQSEGKSGPVLATMMIAQGRAGETSVMLDAPSRYALDHGQLVLRLFTPKSPLGGPAAVISSRKPESNHKR